ncbi:MAG: sugar phosphate isomerase/epimerase [Clostridiales bacterium]|nr:sugar phosphate isomerase/epimerase [Candidatus Coliplasma caballi]
MKIGVSLYSFHGYAADDSLGIKGCIDKAKEFGCEGVDFVEFGAGLTQDQYLAKAKEYGDYCKEKGVEAVCFCVGSDFLNRDPDAEVERVKGLVDVAVALGAKCMRHDATPGYPNTVKTLRSFDAVLPRLAKAYREVTQYAKQFGLKTCIENHGFFAQDPDRVEKLINAVGDENFGALVDIGNFACADADHAYAVGVMAPYAIHALAKDFHKLPGTAPAPGEGWFMSRGGNYLRGSIIGHGNVPVKQCIGILQRAGYEGYLMIEFEGMEDPLKGIRIGADNLRRFLNA